MNQPLSVQDQMYIQQFIQNNPTHPLALMSKKLTAMVLSVLADRDIEEAKSNEVFESEIVE